MSTFTIAGVHVDASVDLNLAKSKISSGWMEAHGRSVGFQLLLPLTMHGADDTVQTTDISFTFEFAHKMPTDVVLGLDWVQAMAVPSGSPSTSGSSPNPAMSCPSTFDGQRADERYTRGGSPIVLEDNPSPHEPVRLQQSDLQNWFFNRSSPAYLLHVGSVKLSRAAEAHGLDVASLDHYATRSQFLHHVVGGLCGSKHTQACSAYAQDNGPADLRRLAFQTLQHIITTAITDEPHIRSVVLELGVGGALTMSRDDLISSLRSLLLPSTEDLSFNITDYANLVENMSKKSLIQHQLLHGVNKATTQAEMKDDLLRHFLDGQCANGHEAFEGCSAVKCQLPAYTAAPLQTSAAILYLSVKSLKSRSLRTALDQMGIPYSASDGPSKLRRLVKRELRLSAKGKRVLDDLDFDSAASASFLDRTKAANQWPPQQTKEGLEDLISEFQASLSSQALSQVVCGSCSQLVFRSESTTVKLNDVNLAPLTRPDKSEYVKPRCQPWLEPNYPEPAAVSVLEDYPDVLVDKAGVVDNNEGCQELILCDSCNSALARDKLPKLSLANKLFLGNVPSELSQLTSIEESMVSLCRAKCTIVQLREEGAKGDPSKSFPNSQRQYKGNTIVYPKNVSEVANLLPPAIEDIVAPICVVFIGQRAPSREWLQEHAKPLAVNAGRVRRALVWLKRNNPLYKDITINEDVLQELGKNPVLPLHIEHLSPNESADGPTSRYDVNEPEEPVQDDVEEALPMAEVPFENVMIADIDNNASTNELRAAALRHMKQKGKDFIAISHESDPEPDFNNPSFFPKLFPTLFPYGLGGIDDPDRETSVSMDLHVRYLMNVGDRRFQTHTSFMFIAFNIMQRRKVLLESHLRIKRDTFDKVLDIYNNISAEDIEAVTDRVARGDYSTSFSDGERTVLKLLREVEVVSTPVQGSSASRLAMRNEIRGMIHSHGLPSFYLTINPADVYNPIVKFLSGDEFDLDKMTTSDVLGYWKQSVLVAKNPAVASHFFDVFIKAFIGTLLGYEGQGSAKQGALGVVKSYYGCVEAQGRGTLHCHMVVWIEGCLTPDAIRAKLQKNSDGMFRERLVEYLEQAISSSIPDDGDKSRRNLKGPNPCADRGPWKKPDETDEAFEERKLKDFAELIRACQIHTHTATCYKYCKPGERKECRFGLDEAAICKESVIDPDTGCLNLRKLDGMAILYYITDYVAKAQLPAHVAYATLEVAVKKLNRFHPEDTPLDVVAKRLLSSCASALLGRQEMSAQQVASYTMGFGDHYTSHEFRRLFWTPFESYLDYTLPSPECYYRTSREEREAGATMNDNGTELEECDDNMEVDEEPSKLHAAVGQNFWVGVDNDGNLRPRMTKVADYALRGPELEDVSLWDFVSQVDKRAIPKTNSEMHTSIEDNDPVDQEVFAGQGNTSSEDEDGTDESHVLWGATSRSIKSEFLPEHCHHDSHRLYVRKPHTRFVPVATGPAIPRRTAPREKARYCRLMLMFFKPWRTAAELRGAFASWEDACNAFIEGDDCPHRARQVIDNMQALTECKQARDDHMSQRSSAQNFSRVPTNLVNSASQDDLVISVDHDESAGDVEDEVLSRLQHIRDIFSDRNLRSLEGVQDAEKRAEEWQLYNFGQKVVEGSIEELSPQYNGELEALWRKAYKARRDAWRKPKTTGESADETNPESDPKLRAVAQIRSLADYRSEENYQQCAPGAYIAGVAALDTNTEESELNEKEAVTIESITEEMTLNDEQELAFTIVAKQADASAQAPPLRMYVGGAAGTGKSRVIDAVRLFFERRGERKRLKLAAYMGIAARNIKGQTLHSLLSLNSLKAQGLSTDVVTSLRHIWEGVDFLVIDEISMISCDFLGKVNEALKYVTRNADLGGLNVLYVGDFAQLPPVLETRLFAQMDTKGCHSKRQLQHRLMGQARWKAVDTVILLAKLNRQSGPQNVRFGQLLGRLREGSCTTEDYELLRTRVIGQNEFATLDSDWADATVIVQENAKRDALNEKGAAAFARATDQELHWYYSEDRCKQASLRGRPELRSYLHSLPSGKTHHLLGRLPLVIGMPVYIGSNFDVSNGVTNGAPGVVKSIRYRMNEHGQRVLVSCIVTVHDADGKPMPHLAKKDVPILPESKPITFSNPYDSTETVNVTRTQLPLSPAFAMTAHKSQGQTLERVIVDLKDTTGIETPYVMLSRARNLRSVLIYGDFDISCLRRNMSEQSRHENERLNRVHLETVVKHGKPRHAAEAAALLRRLRTSRLSTTEASLVRARRDLDSTKRKRPLIEGDNEVDHAEKRVRLESVL